MQISVIKNAFCMPHLLPIKMGRGDTFRARLPQFPKWEDYKSKWQSSLSAQWGESSPVLPLLFCHHLNLQPIHHSRDFHHVQNAWAFFWERFLHAERCQKESGSAVASGGKATGEMSVQKHGGRQLTREQISLLPMLVSFSYQSFVIVLVV